MEAFPATPGVQLPSLKGATILLPAVAHANLGELAMDVLIGSLLLSDGSLALVARLDEANCLPVVGNDAYSLEQPGTMATALELYHMQGTTTYFLQQRAPAAKGRQAAFASNMADWLQGQGVQQVVVLCGLDAQLRRDVQIVGTPLRFLTSNAALKEACACQPGLQPLEDTFLADEKQEHGPLPPWTLLAACEQRALPTLLLSGFATEGDNQAGAMALARQAASLAPHLGGSKGPWAGSGGGGGEGLPLRAPCSWAALYGRVERAMGLQ